MLPRFRRNFIVALSFGAIWASIQYTQGRITDLHVLAVRVAVFVVMGVLLISGVQALVDWYKKRQ
jgi:hypothetical protein